MSTPSRSATSRAIGGVPLGLAHDVRVVRPVAKGTSLSWSDVAIDTSTRFCAFLGVARGGTVAYSLGFTGLGVGATRFGANVMLDLLDGADTERTRLRMVRERPLPFPPEPLTYTVVQAMRWSLDRADHNHGRRNAFLRGMDALGLGFDS